MILRKVTRFVPILILIPEGEVSGDFILIAKSLHPELKHAEITKIVFHSAWRGHVLCKDIESRVSWLREAHTSWLKNGRVPLDFIQDNWPTIVLNPDSDFRISLARSADSKHTGDIAVSVTMLTEITYPNQGTNS